MPDYRVYLCVSFETMTPDPPTTPPVLFDLHANGTRIPIDPNLHFPYPPPILVNHHTWFLPDADFFISIQGILYGLHQ